MPRFRSSAQGGLSICLSQYAYAHPGACNANSEENSLDPKNCISAISFNAQIFFDSYILAQPNAGVEIQIGAQEVP